MRHFKLVLAALVMAQVALPAQSSRIPTPESSFGFPAGADYKLATYEQVVNYFRTIDRASDLVTLVDAGRTSQGRTFYFALVSSKANLANIDRYREIARRLAHPNGLSEEAARRLAHEGKAFVHIDGGLHSTELAGPQHTPQLLYDIVTRAGERDVAAMLDNVVLMLWPTINPDGHQMVADWYMNTARTPQAGTSFPGLYQDYVGHDNNRDGYMLNMIESRALEFTWRQWEPHIIYVHHQSAPFPTRIWLPPFAEPIARHAPSLMSREVNMIGMAIAKRLEEQGQVGATHMGSGYDAWYAGYIDYTPMFKNIAAFWTETAGGGLAPRQSAITDFPDDMRDLRPQTLYASPWRPGLWRLRDQVEYMETASLAVLEFASKYKESLLLNRYRAGRDQIALGQSAPPHAYFVPQDQRDPVAAVELLRRLAFAGVRVLQLASPQNVGGETLAPGTWVVPADQEFGALAREVLEPQQYPDLREFPGGPPEQPYDAAGWTLPLAMGVRIVPAAAPLTGAMRAAMRPLGPFPAARIAPQPYLGTRVADAAPFDSVPGLGFDADPMAAAIVPPAGQVSGAGPSLAVDPSQNNAFRAVNRALGAGLDVQFAAGSGAGNGRYVLAGLSEQDQRDLVRSLALVAERTTREGARLRPPRIGVFDVPSSMDAGWTRWLLDQYGFRYVAVSGADVQMGSLGNTLDVLIVTDEPRGVLDSTGRGGRGSAQTAADAGAAAPQISGNEQRVRAIEEFVRNGGTLVCLNRSTGFAIEQLHLPVRNVLAGAGRQDFFAGGSLLRVITDPTHRVMAGMPQEAAVFFQAGPAFETLEGFKGTVLARYPADGSPLVSGYLLGEKHLQGKAAALDVELGGGHIVLIGFRPQWRGQPFGTFRILFNAALYVR